MLLLVMMLWLYIDCVMVVDNKQNLVEDNKGTRPMLQGCFRSFLLFLQTTHGMTIIIFCDRINLLNRIKL